MTDKINLGIDGLGPATLIERGGSAYVYLAEQLAFGRKVAVKVLFQALEDPATLRRFERECRAIGAVSDHPNIVVVHGRGLTNDDRPYLVMEHRQGGSLADRLETRNRLTEVETTAIGSKIARALSVAHDAGVIHRDVKPGNILLSNYGEPALADFGIARMDGAHKTTAGIVSASVKHASREVLNGGDATIQSDIYSLGSTLFALVAGRPPFVDPSDDSVWTLINRVLTTDAPDAEHHGVSEPLAAVIRSALAHDLADRYQTAAEMAEALEGLASGNGIKSKRNNQTEQFEFTSPPTTAEFTGSSQPPEPFADSAVPLARSVTESGGNSSTEPFSGSATGNQSTDTTSTSDSTSLHLSVRSIGDRSARSSQIGDKDPAIAASNHVSTRASTHLNRPLLAVGASALLVAVAATAFLLPVLRDGGRQQNSEAAVGADLTASNPISNSLVSNDDPASNGAVDAASADSPMLDFRQAEIGPLVIDRRYALSVIGPQPGARYRILLDGEAVKEFEDSLPVFFPTSAGRYELTVEIETAQTVATTNPVDIYVSAGQPEPGYRVNLASVRSAPPNWPQALAQFDRLLAEDHENLQLSLSTNGESDDLPFWNFYVGGFGDDSAGAQAYCDERDLTPAQCFPGLVSS